MSSTLASLTLFLVVPLLALASLCLWWLVVKRRNPVTQAHAIGVTVVLVYTFVFGLIFVNNDQPVPWLNTETTKLITRSMTFGGGIIVALTVLLLLLPLPGRKR